MNKDIKSYIEEFIKMKEGEKISNPEFCILICDKAQFTRKSLKHFVESRLKARNSREEIYYLIDKAPEVINKPQINIPNTNKTYPNSFLLGRFYEDVNKAVMVILDKGNDIRDIISLHFKNKSDFDYLMKLYSK